MGQQQSIRGDGGDSGRSPPRSGMSGSPIGSPPRGNVMWGSPYLGRSVGQRSGVLAMSPTVKLAEPSHVIDDLDEGEDESEQPAVVPTVLKWKSGDKMPKSVYVCGSWNGWRTRIPLTRSENDFTTIQLLEPGAHRYKFIVDDQWCCSPHQKIVSDAAGNMSNIVDVTSAEPLPDEPEVAGRHSPPGEYGQVCIDSDETYAKDPPMLPAHLVHAPLNKGADRPTEDTTVLPVPHHVMLNHLYIQPQRDGVIKQAMTYRYKNKFVTTVLYKQIPYAGRRP